MTSQTTQASHLNTLIQSPALPLSLRTIQPPDAPFFSAILAQDPNERPIDLPLAGDIIARQRESANQPTVCGPDGQVVSGPSRVNMVLVLKVDNEPEGLPIGLGGFGAIKDWERDGKKIRAGDVGVLIDPKYRGKGYAVEAMKMAINWAFSPVNAGGPQLDLITITTLEENTAMLNLVKKLGIKGEGITRPVEHEEGKQEVYYEVKPEDWQEASAVGILN
ncbi:hypothetical protein PT974_00976 [Cladobotryum mycophilum]|uniref:N-acetyltransferase domain-containing protein n=1 Tax=Cladobotryum mycophilum TaxID=491253 RepID=A0ABR0T3J7_9HYPO